MLNFPKKVSHNAYLSTIMFNFPKKVSHNVYIPFNWFCSVISAARLSSAVEGVRLAIADGRSNWLCSIILAARLSSAVGVVRWVSIWFLLFVAAGDWSVRLFSSVRPNFTARAGRDKLGANQPYDVLKASVHVALSAVVIFSWGVCARGYFDHCLHAFLHW